MVNTAHHLKDAVDLALDKNQTFYPPIAGIEDLRASATRWMNDTYQTRYETKNTLITCGGKFGIYLLLQALLNEGDEVIIIAPYWVSYPPMAILFGGKPVIVDTEEKDGWKVRPEQIKAACNEKTKLLILNNGSNPTGAIYSESELKEILEICKEKGVLVLSDEVYSGLTYDGKIYVSCASFPDYSDGVIVVQSCSKNFGMTGWRVGMVFAPEEIIKKLTMLQGQSISGTSIISQSAAIAAFGKAKEITQEINREMESRRNIFTDTFNASFPGANLKNPQSALYHFIPLKAFGIPETDDVKFCEQALKKGNVAMVPGTAFGKPGYVRTSFGGKSEEIVAAIKALAGYFRV